MEIDIIPLVRGEDFIDEEECDRCERIKDIMFDFEVEVLCLNCALEAYPTEMNECIVKAFKKQDTGEMTLNELKAHIDAKTINN